MFRAHRRHRAERDQRQLLIAAAGMAGGEALKKVMAMIEAELKAVSGAGCQVSGEESEMPLSAEDLRRQLGE